MGKRRHIVLPRLSDFMGATFALLFTAALLPIGCTFASTVYVSSDSHCNDTLCCTLPSPSPNTPCCSLSWVVDHCLGNNTEVIFLGENYDFNETVSFIGYGNIALKGSKQVVVKCKLEAGLSFIQCHDILIMGIEFKNCGTLQNSTSHDFNDNRILFKQTHVAMYFQFCLNIELMLVRVTSSRGIGVVILASGGTNSIQNSTFFGNTPANYEGSGGGGLQIEFPYCSPRDQTVCHVTLDSEFNSKAIYEITNCVFDSNIATPNMEPSYYQFLPPESNHHSSVGHGGGLGLHFCKASNIQVTINDSIFVNNQAYYGSGISCSFEEYSINNTVLISDSGAGEENACSISNNRGILQEVQYSDLYYGSGGGLHVLFWFSYLANHSSNSFSVTKCHFEGNKAYFGGATLIKASPETTEIDPTNSVFFSDCEWTSNSGKVGGAMLISAFNESVKRGALLKPVFEACVIQENQGNFIVDNLPIAFTRSIDFFENSGPLTVDDSTVEFQENCQARFIHNKASYGGALSLHGHAFLRVFENTSFLFRRNYARRDGGAIYQSTTGTQVVRNGPCFIQYHDRTIPPHDWNTSFIFDSNQENVRTGNPVCNSILLGSVVPCIWQGYMYQDSQNHDVLLGAICKEWSSLLQFNSTNCTSRFINISTSDYDDCTQHIHTLPNKLESINSSLHVTPGQPANLGIKILDDFGLNIFEQSVLNVWTANSTLMRLAPNIFYLTGDTLTMYGDSSNNYSQNAQLYIDTLPPRPLFLPINITFKQCPPGFIQTHGNRSVRATCECRNGFNGNVLCNGANFASLRNGYWIGKQHKGDSEYVAGYMPYFQSAGNFSGITLPNDNYSNSDLNDLICGPLNRRGILCGSCQNGYAPSLHGYTLNKCVKCHKGIIEWIAIAIFNLLPVTIFLLLVLMFNVSATSGAMNFFVFFAQVITQSFFTGSIPTHENLKIVSYLYNTLYSLWLLEIKFPANDVCLYGSIPAPHVFLIYYCQALYTIVFIGVFLLLVKLHDHGVQPFYGLGKWLHNKLRRFRRPWTVQRSVIHALATFLVLSFTKITAVSFILLAPSPLYNHDGEFVKFVPEYYGNSSDAVYAGYIVIALVFLTIFNIIPILLLLILPTKTSFGRLICNNVLKVCCTNPQNTKLQQFLQVFQGTFKDGSGSKNEINCQKFAGFYLLLRFLIFMLAALAPVAWFLLGQQVLVTLAIVMIAIFQPYKKRVYNVIDILAFFMLATINSITTFYENESALRQDVDISLLIVQYFLVFLPLVIMIVVISWKTLNYLCIRQLCPSFSLRRHRAKTETDGEFVSFIAATSERDSETEDRNESGSPRSSSQYGSMDDNVD